MTGLNTCLSRIFVSLAAVALTSSAAFALPIEKTIHNPAQPQQVTLVLDPSAQSDLDLLIVLDDSGSMGTFQQKLASNITGLASLLQTSFASAHVGITTTSLCAGSYQYCRNGMLVGARPVLEPSSPTFVNDLIQTLVTVGTQGSGEEKPFAGAIAALSSPMSETSNAGFLRTNAHLAVVLVTDAEDQSSQSAEEFVSFLESKKGAAHFSLNAFISKSESCQKDDGMTKPMKIEAAVTLAKGKSYDLCQADFATALNEIGTQLGTELEHSIQLPYKPIVQSITVRFGTEELAAGDIHQGWTYNSKDNTIILGDEITWKDHPGEKLQIQFTIK